MRVIKRDFYKGLANELLSKFRRINSFTSHGPSIGSYHEEALRDVIRNFLPERFSLKTGFVFKNNKEVSNQIDVLIIDENESRSYLLKEGNFVIVRPECVVASIEIKSELTKKSFKQGVNNVYSVRKLRPKILGFIFSFSGNRFTPPTLDKWYKDISIPDKQKNYPFMVLNLKKGRLDLRPKSKLTKTWGHYYVMHGSSRNEKADNLSVFLQAVVKTVQLADGKEDNPFTFAVIKGQKWTKEYLRFSKGLVTPSNS